jgi:hypothetical protein
VKVVGCQDLHGIADSVELGVGVVAVGSGVQVGDAAGADES